MNAKKEFDLGGRALTAAAKILLALDGLSDDERLEVVAFVVKVHCEKPEWIGLLADRVKPHVTRPERGAAE